MKGPDWGSYLAGQMGKEERTHLESLLASSEQARKEFAGFVAFRASVAEQARMEEVPVEALEQALKAVRGESPVVRRLCRLRVALAAASLLIAAYVGFQVVTYDPMSLNTTPTAARIATEEPSIAMHWIRSKTPFEAPLVRLSGKARMAGARYGEGWACYDYDADGQQFFLYMSMSGESLRRGSQDELDGYSIWKGKGLGWLAGRYAFYLRGGTEKTRATLAAAALKETGADRL